MTRFVVLGPAVGALGFAPWATLDVPLPAALLLASLALVNPLTAAWIWGVGAIPALVTGLAVARTPGRLHRILAGAIVGPVSSAMAGAAVTVASGFDNDDSVRLTAELAFGGLLAALVCTLATLRTSMPAP